MKRCLVIGMVLWGGLAFSGCQPQTDAESSPPSPVAVASRAPEQPTAQSVTPAPISEAAVTLPVPGMDAPVALVVGTDSIKLGSSFEARRQSQGVVVYKDGAVVATAIKKEKRDHFIVADASGSKVAKFKPRDDGSIKVVGADELMLCKIKLRDDGFKVVDSDEETVLIKVKASDGKIKVKDGKETELAKIKGSNEADVVTWLSIGKLPVEVRLAGALLFRK